MSHDVYRPPSANDEAKLKSLRLQVEKLTAENLDLVRQLTAMENERQLTPAKIEKLYQQADCSHPELIDRICIGCGRDMLTDVYLERAWSFMESRKPYPWQSVDWVGVRRLAGLLRDVGGCSELERKVPYTKVVSRNLVRNIVAPTQMGLCVACGYMRPLLQTNICLGCYDND